MPNMHEVIARERKARAIAVVLYAQNVSAYEARQLSYGERQLMAAACGQRVPSDETWAVVVEELERFAATPSMRQPADPFDSLPGCERAS